MKKYILAAFLALLAPLHADWAPGTALPSLSASGLEGNVPSIAGKVVVLDFFASWCVPCKQSMPALEAMHKELKAKGLVVIGVSVDEKAEDMAGFLKKTPVTFSTVRDAGKKLVTAANVATMPTTVIVDRKGKIQHIHSGFRKGDDAKLRAVIEKLLAQK